MSLSAGAHTDRFVLQDSTRARETSTVLAASSIVLRERLPRRAASAKPSGLHTGGRVLVKPHRIERAR